MYRKNKLKAIVAIAVALAFILPTSAAFANVETPVEETPIETPIEDEIIWEYFASGTSYGVECLEDGNILICESGNGGRVIEVDQKGDVVWECSDGFTNPYDAERLPDGNTLITDSYPGNRVIEVDPSGLIVWTYDAVKSPCDADRLPDGNTLITDASAFSPEIIEVTSTGAVVWRYDRDWEGSYPTDADRLEGGNTLITKTAEWVPSEIAHVIEVTPAGATVWNHPSAGYTFPQDADRLESGNTLMCGFPYNHVTEVDSSHNVVWEYWDADEINYLTDAERLESGNTLISGGFNGHVFIVGTPSNNPPYKPKDPDPSDGAIDVSVNADLEWTGGDPDGDDVKYDVYFDTETPPEQVVTKQPETTYDPGTMIPDQKYYWKIVAWDDSDASTEGDIWSFTTELPDTTPPEITIVTLTTSDPIDTESDFGWEKVTCKVTDNVEVRDVRIFITDPDGLTTDYPMDKNGDIYSYQITLTIVGDYEYYVWADDTSGNPAQSSPETFILPPNWEVDMDYETRIIDFWDLVEVVKYYMQTDTPGWIRADVDNDGTADFWDLVEIVKYYMVTW